MCIPHHTIHLIPGISELYNPLRPDSTNDVQQRMLSIVLHTAGCEHIIEANDIDPTVAGR